MKKKYLLSNIDLINLNIKSPCLIFLKGDLGSGKTTFAKYIINKLLGIKSNILSPTYTYYNKYEINNTYIYHFDLYKLKKYDEFFSIGGEEILDNNNGIILVEWPEIISTYYKSDICIELERTKNQNERLIQINYNN